MLTSAAIREVYNRPTASSYTTAVSSLTLTTSERFVTPHHSTIAALQARTRRFTASGASGRR